MYFPSPDQTAPVYDPDQMLTENQVADLICQSVRTIQKWRVIGFGPAFFKIGRSVRYRRRDVSQWIESRRRRHTSEEGPDNVI